MCDTDAVRKSHGLKQQQVNHGAGHDCPLNIDTASSVLSRDGCKIHMESYVLQMNGNHILTINVEIRWYMNFT